MRYLLIRIRSVDYNNAAAEGRADTRGLRRTCICMSFPLRVANEEHSESVNVLKG